MKQAAFAGRLGIPLPRLKNYELARSPIRYELGDKLCQEFNINQRWLAVGVFSQRGYFSIPPILQKSLPRRQLFSEVYGLIIDEIEVEALRWLFSPDVDDSPLVASDFPHGVTSSLIRNLWIENLKQELNAACGELPDAPFHQLMVEVKKLIGKHLSENRNLRDEYVSSHKKREAELEAICETFVRDRLAGNKGRAEAQGLVTLAASIEQARKGEGSSLRKHKLGNESLTPFEFLTYSDERNETPPHSMQKNVISQRIKAARESLGLSQSQASEKWNIRLQTIQQWEHGRREPRGLYRERIENILSEIEGSKS